jgi:hypothetical protein
VPAPAKGRVHIHSVGLHAQEMQHLVHEDRYMWTHPGTPRLSPARSC